MRGGEDSGTRGQRSTREASSLGPPGPQASLGQMGAIGVPFFFFFPERRADLTGFKRILQLPVENRW